MVSMYLLHVFNSLSVELTLCRLHSSIPRSQNGQTDLLDNPVTRAYRIEERLRKLFLPKLPAVFVGGSVESAHHENCWHYQTLLIGLYVFQSTG